jgi:hypothetical protein
MSDIWIPDRNRPRVVLYLVSYIKNTIPDFWGIPIEARVVFERVVITLTDEIHPYDTEYGLHHAGVYADESGRRFWEYPGFAGLARWCMLGEPKDLPLAEWKDEIYPGGRYVRDGEPVLAETLNAESAALIGQHA